MRNIAIILIVLSIAGCGEIMNNEAKSYEQAQPLIDAGWLPKWFPQTAIDIREAHNTDTNAVVASFNINDELWAPSNCEQIGPFEAPAPDLKVGWWPGDVPASQLSTYRHIFYKCPNDAYIAITPDRSEANYWSNSR
jgi:hypothetical protein